MLHQVVWSHTEGCPCGGHVASVGAVARGSEEPRDWSAEEVALASAEGAQFYLVDDEGFPQVVDATRCACGEACLVSDPGPRSTHGWALRLLTKKRYLWQQLAGPAPADGPDQAREPDDPEA